MKFRSTRLFKVMRFLPFAILLMVFGQQCAETPLTKITEFQHASSVEAGRLAQPVDQISVQRYIIAIDMSWSMVAGPCPQDVSELRTYDPSTTPLRARESYDPNFAGGKYYSEMSGGRYFNANEDVSIENGEENDVRADGYPFTLNFGGTRTVSGTFSNNEFDHINSGVDCSINPTMEQDYEKALTLWSTKKWKRFPAGVTPGTKYIMPNWVAPSHGGSPWNTSPFNALPYTQPSGASSLLSLAFPFFDYDAGYYRDPLDYRKSKKNPQLYNVYSTYPGLDPTGKRFDLATKLLKQIQTSEAGRDTASKAQVLIVPVTGGRAQQRLLGKFSLSFTSVEGALAIVEGLKKEQLDENYTPSLSAGDEWRYEKRTMGTTAPNDVLWGIENPSKLGEFRIRSFDEMNQGAPMGGNKSVYSLIKDEMVKLQSKKLLPRADFRFLMLTDGRVSPTVTEIRTAREFLGCPAPYNTSCFYDSVFQQYWGDYTINTKEKLTNTLKVFSELPKTSFEDEGRMSVDIIDLNAYATNNRLFPQAWQNDPEKAPFFSGVSDSIAKVWNLYGSDFSQTNYNPSTVSNDPTVFEIRQIYVLNLNVRSRDDGRICVDSDADGLCDDDEKSTGTSPTNPRTDGYCLDSIALRFPGSCQAMAAQQLCDPLIDSDSDGLNACEESVLGTSYHDFDSDDDDIPDYLAWLYGYSPIASVRNADSNGDGVADITNFKAGLGPNQVYADVAANLKSSYSTNEFSFQAENGRWMKSKELKISFLPNAPLLPLTNDEALAYATKDEQGRPIPTAETLPTFTKDSFQNQFIVVAKIIDTTNPLNVYWYVYRDSFDLRTRTLKESIPLTSYVQIKMAMDPQK